MRVKDFSHSVLGRVNEMCFYENEKVLSVSTDKGTYNFSIFVSDNPSVSNLKFLRLDSREYIVSADDKDGVDYDVFYNGKKISDVTKIVRLGGVE